MIFPFTFVNSHLLIELWILSIFLCTLVFRTLVVSRLPDGHRLELSPSGFRTATGFQAAFGLECWVTRRSCLNGKAAKNHTHSSFYKHQSSSPHEELSRFNLDQLGHLMPLVFVARSLPSMLRGPIFYSLLGSFVRGVLYLLRRFPAQANCS